VAEKREIRILHRDRRMVGRNITTSEKVNSITDRDFRIWTHLLVSPDDDGRLEGNPLTVKMTCLPGLPYSIDEVAESLQRLHDIGLIIWYEVGGKRYIQICQWEENQRFHGWTRYPSIYPSPNGDSEAGSPEIPESGEAGSPENERTGDTNRQEIRDKGQVEEKEEQHLSGTESPTSPHPSSAAKGKAEEESPACFDEDSTAYLVADAESEPSILATELKDAILRWKPGTRTAGFSKWPRTIDLMIRKDGRTPDAIRNAISWLYGPNTERGEYAILVLSAQALRDKFDQIEFSMNKRSTQNTKSPGGKLAEAAMKRRKSI
jgi:hypothetical protein